VTIVPLSARCGFVAAAEHDPDQAVTAAAIVALTMAVEPATSEDQHEYDDDDD
jgi:hypothetical protein